MTPAGELAEASVADYPDLLYMVRSSHGLMGVVYEVTLRVKPIEVLHFSYLPRPVAELTEAEVAKLLDDSEGLICWQIGATAVFQSRHRVENRKHPELAHGGCSPLALGSRRTPHYAPPHRSIPL